jgi:hypothetical protein
MTIASYRRFGHQVRHKKSNETDENVQPHRWQKSHTPAGQVLFGEQGGSCKQVFDGAPETAIVMGKVFHEMPDQVAKRLPGFNIFLAAIRAEPYFYTMATILAGIIFPQMMRTHMVGVIDKYPISCQPLRNEKI